MQNLVTSHSSGLAPAQAALLIGPTGSGKTPLGELLEKRGWNSRQCRHFDFGAHLRKAADPSRAASMGLTSSEISVVLGCLEHGTLLENETFGIAAKILDSFVSNAINDPEELLILNGLPRHVSQAKMLVEHVTVHTLLVLECGADTVHDRIRLDSGGDRGHRDDDTKNAIQQRLDIYRRRTIPLIEHYQSMGARILRLPVGVSTSALQLLTDLENK